MPPTDEDASNTGECDGQSSEPAAVDANARPKVKAKGKAQSLSPKERLRRRPRPTTWMKRPASKPMEKNTPSKKEKGAKEKGAQPKKQEVKEEWKEPEHDGCR